MTEETPFVGGPLHGQVRVVETARYVTARFATDRPADFNITDVVYTRKSAVVWLPARTLPQMVRVFRHDELPVEEDEMALYDATMHAWWLGWAPSDGTNLWSLAMPKERKP